MKPDWKDAPEWANWLAMDSDGVWYWYKDSPERYIGEWGGGVLAERAGIAIEWHESLEARP